MQYDRTEVDKKRGDHASMGCDEGLLSEAGGGGGGTCGFLIISICCVLSDLYARWGRTLTSKRVFSAIILWNPIPTPSITAKKQAHIIAEFLAAFIPPRTARAPPVKNPAITVGALCQYCFLSWWGRLHQWSDIDSTRTGIVGIFLLPYALNRTIECREHASPHAKVTPQDRCSCLDRRDGTYPSFTIGTVSKAFHTVPYCATDGL